MQKILILFAHPALEKSRVHQQLIRVVRDLEFVTFNDLYEKYPDFDIDVEREKALLLQHDIIVWQHPFYWYGSPAMIKQWIDLVLEHGWAYGKNGRMLEGKTLFNAISTGGPDFAYGENGFNKYSIRQFLAPFQQTVVLCRMKYLPPFVIHGTHRLEPAHAKEYANRYSQLLQKLSTGEITIEQAQQVNYLNDLLSLPATS